MWVHAFCCSNCQTIDLFYKHTSYNIVSTKVPETNTKENYIAVNFMLMVTSERNTVIQSRLNCFMSPYFLLQNKEGRAVFLTMRRNAV